METMHLIETIDTHTAGEPTRIVTGGLGWSSRGETVREQSDRFAAEHDWVRRLLMQEPRGHEDMFGAIPVEPAADVDLGLLFLTHDGVGELCGHAIMGVVSAFVETGRFDPSAEVRIETPVGVTVARPISNGDRVCQVAVETPAAFAYDRTSIHVTGLGEVQVDIVYGGIYFAMVDAEATGIDLDMTNAEAIRRHGVEIRDRINDAIDIVHPMTGEPRQVLLTEFYQSTEPVDRNAVVLADGSLDRSPCGTGTCARMAHLHEREQLSVGETYRIEGPIGTQFEGRLLGATERDGVTVMRPEVVGSAYPIRQNTFTVDPADPLTGFSI